MFYGLELRLRLAISRAMRSVAGGICLAVGAVFLTIAGWIALVDAYDALTAALAIGGGYFLLGIILLLSTRFRRAHAPPPVTAGSLIEAFLAGRAAGGAVRPRRY